MWALKFLAIFALTYAGIILVIWFTQAALLFPTTLAHGAPPLPPGAERLVIDTPDGERLHGVRIHPAAPEQHRTILLAFPGNAWNAEDMAAYLHDLLPAAEIVAFHYRGYKPSTGHPSAAALLADAPLAYDAAIGQRENATIVAAGFSIGSGVAAHLARERPLDGLVLVTPFDTLEQLAGQHYWWLPVRLLLRHRMSPVEDLRAVNTPVALIAAERDTIIPARRTAPLRSAARNLVLDETIPGAGHNDIYAHPRFAPAMRQALSLMRPPLAASSFDEPAR